jgi:phosphopantothenate synthetase
VLSDNSQSNQHKFIRRSIASAFLTQAIIIGINGNLDVLSGKPVLDVIPSMITQTIELILKTHRTQKSFEEIDRIKKDRIAQNPDD